MIREIKHAAKLSLLLIALIGISGICEAKSLDGYIVTSDNDTIKGLIKVYTFNRRTGVLNISSGMAIEMCFVEVPFRQSKQEKYKIYKPEDIKGYGFWNQGVPYEFKTFLISQRSLNLKEEKKNYFLQLTGHKGKYKIYTHQKFSKNNNTGELTPSYIVYFCNEKGEIHRFEQ